MQVEVANELVERLKPEKSGLQVAATYVFEDELVKNYLNRPYGNAYDFDQTDRIEGIF
jgi:hypothetical protein